MSRIEQALEKAGQIKDSLPPAFDADRYNATCNHSAELLLEAPALQIQSRKLLAMNEKNSLVSEEYKKLRSLVLAKTRKAPFYNSLMITSTVSGEGKTLTAINLAMALAKAYDHTVLLVDADLRQPTLHQLFGIAPEVGLIQCLQNDLPLHKALIKTGIGKLVILPAGGVFHNPAELLSSERMKKIVQELKERYQDRYILFDTPPVLPFADAQVLATAVDGTLFVVREGKSALAEVKKAMDTVQDANPLGVIGVVYNGSRLLPPKKHVGYY